MSRKKIAKTTIKCTKTRCCVYAKPYKPSSKAQRCFNVKRK